MAMGRAHARHMAAIFAILFKDHSSSVATLLPPMAEIVSNESPPSALDLSDRPLDKKLVEELRSIASTMNLDFSDTRKASLLQAIKRALKTDVEIANDARFIPFVQELTK
ncbi:hypothetical protein K438DRAFT_1982923 [Mycena galopus ATCC 62051]|nr:hypothetical protein K438DRAFT_1982923 [Mycena galopus ATCC 62051]